MGPFNTECQGKPKIKNILYKGMTKPMWGKKPCEMRVYKTPLFHFGTNVGSCRQAALNNE